MTRSVLPQGFRDSPHLFDYLQTKRIKYVDDFLHYAPSEEVSQESMRVFLNFPAERGYKVSETKTQFCQTSVTYLDLV